MSGVRRLKRFSGLTGTSRTDSVFDASLFAFQVILEVCYLITLNKIAASIKL